MAKDGNIYDSGPIKSRHSEDYKNNYDKIFKKDKKKEKETLKPIYKAGY